MTIACSIVAAHGTSLIILLMTGVVAVANAMLRLVEADQSHTPLVSGYAASCSHSFFQCSILHQSQLIHEYFVLVLVLMFDVG
jgi:hypothetical protein